MHPVDLVIMSGFTDDGDAARMVSGARRAITRDLVARALSVGAFERIIVSTNDAMLVDLLDPPVIVDLDHTEEPFQFGSRLHQLIQKYDIERIVYMGGGAAPLASTDLMRVLAERVGVSDSLLLCNNFYSVDFCAFTPASCLLVAPPPKNDNELGWLLGRRLGLPAEELERNAETTFDVDTPADLAVLALHPRTPPHTRTYLESLNLDLSRLETALDVFSSRGGQALISGRVGSRVLAHLERYSACRTRVFSEERGMRADGRLARGEARSMVAMLMDALGVERLFQEALPQLCDAAFIDDRVLWAHRQVWPSPEDRFNSDLFRVERIQDPFTRAFTQAALNSPIPVILGGHSLVSGGMYVLVETAWARSERDYDRPVTSLG